MAILVGPKVLHEFRLEHVTDVPPTACRLVNADPPNIDRAVCPKADGDLPIRVVFGNKPNMRLIPVDAHPITSFRMSALIRSPL